jgi:nucleoside-diphosphate-sugar epimerase
MRIFVTGASGFIGGVLCGQLLERGHEVGALVRRPGSEPSGTRAVAGDLDDGARLSEALAAERPDCVIHLAAEIASQRSERKLREVNIDGTAHLLDACLALAGEQPSAGPRIVFASTVVTGEAHGALLSEDTPLPVETPYGRSKQEGERLVLESGLPAVIVRPSHVYGPGGWYAQELVARLRQPGRFAVIGSGSNLWDVVHVEDVASALALAAEQVSPGSAEHASQTSTGQASPGRIYHVVDDQPIAYGDFMRLTAEALGVGPPRHIPRALARVVAGRNAVAAVVRSARSSNLRIKRELGWAPRFPSAHEGIPAAVAQLDGRQLPPVDAAAMRADIDEHLDVSL